MFNPKLDKIAPYVSTLQTQNITLIPLGCGDLAKASISSILHFCVASLTYWAKHETINNLAKL